jgi:hypothetical protein
VTTFRNFLSLVDLGSLGPQQFVSLLAQTQNGGSGHGSLGNLGENPLRDGSGIVILGEGVGVPKGIVYCRL